MRLDVGFTSGRRYLVDSMDVVIVLEYWCLNVGKNSVIKN